MHPIAESFFDVAWCLKEQPSARRLQSRGGEILCRPCWKSVCQCCSWSKQWYSRSCAHPQHRTVAAMPDLVWMQLNFPQTHNPPFSPTSRCDSLAVWRWEGVRKLTHLRNYLFSFLLYPFKKCHVLLLSSACFAPLGPSFAQSEPELVLGWC